MKRRIYLSLLATVCWALVWGQARQVTGRVVSDSARQPLSGVTVTVKGTNTSTFTNDEGRYTISAPGNGTLVFTFIGYNPQEVAVKDQVTINVTMATSAGTALSDIVVVGYQSVRRRDLTGSVASVNSRQIKDVPLASAAEAIQGRLAGVQVTSSEGAPGADIVIRVRGGGSITQDNSPLYIVDGVQVENALNVIAPQDIASVDVLKDASTTAIYGARGANGVILITTKSGRAGKTVVSYSGQVGFRELPKTMNVLNPYDFVVWQYERTRGTATDEADFARLYGTTWDTLQNYKNVPAINWQEEVFGRKATFQNHNVSVSGGNAATNFSLSLTDNKEEGIQLETGYDRKLVNFKLDHRISDKIRFG
ncbi:MAG TPA: TonB-dependent receptor plug domain-containing protein, partial [Flavisolibacter sp.]|nr:TonB-dependent receptor plug domain-containing protein [Flavisolibacter sp.]